MKDWIAISAEPGTDKPRAWKITDSSVSSLKAVKKYRNLKFVYYSVGHFVKLMRRVQYVQQRRLYPRERDLTTFKALYFYQRPCNTCFLSLEVFSSCLSLQIPFSFFVRLYGLICFVKITVRSRFLPYGDRPLRKKTYLEYVDCWYRVL